MEGEEMIKYRFTKKEVDEMSFNIRTHTDNEKSEAKKRVAVAPVIGRAGVLL